MSTFAQDSGAGGAASLLPLFLFGFVAVVLFVLPARRRARTTRAVQEALGPGREVMTAGGLVATVVDLDEKFVTLEIAPGVHARYVRGAVAQVVDEPAPMPETIEEPGPG